MVKFNVVTRLLFFFFITIALVYIGVLNFQDNSFDDEKKLSSEFMKELNSSFSGEVLEIEHTMYGNAYVTISSEELDEIYPNYLILFERYFSGSKVTPNYSFLKKINEKTYRVHLNGSFLYIKEGDYITAFPANEIYIIYREDSLIKNLTLGL